MKKSRHRYVVLKLLTTINVYGVSEKLGGCAGYLPVFLTEKEAKKVAGKKFDIITITEHYE
ncbi:hypothetical protein LCGC14_0579290 [marine sediment metagenome]|uniref:Uncharacterized protein n=1 Tax=marine sediment metagenome TaxID=412755 RepID=A0A0F9RGT9_9ZZZZ